MILAITAILVLFAACSSQPEPGPPRGYLAELQVPVEGGLLSFGPFVGYYFRPLDPRDLSRLEFVCFNERAYYTDELPAGEEIFRGQAVLVRLPDLGDGLPDQEMRIRPVFFPDAPQKWLDTRPEPRDEFVHFHSCHQAGRPVMTGFWIRHEGLKEFTYNMGGRVDADSPLYHKVKPGVDKDFPKIVEFDKGK